MSDLPTRVEELKRLEAEATPGEWRSTGPVFAGPGRESVIVETPYSYLLRMFTPNGPVGCNSRAPETFDECLANSKFIAAARNTVPDLIADWKVKAAQLAACQRDAEWFKLLAWGLRDMLCVPNNKEFAGTAIVGVKHRDGGPWLYFNGEHPLDDDGLPIRTDELLAALLKAKGEVREDV